MKKFTKPTFIDLEKDEYYNEVKNIICFPNYKISAGGTYIKFGKEKSCDLDLYQDILEKNLDKFKNYIKNLKKHKNKYHLIRCQIYIPHKILDDIYQNLGYLNGNLKIIEEKNKDEIIPIIKKLPESLIKDIMNLYDNYLSSKDLMDFLKLKIFIRKKIYANWTLDELYDGKKIYYDQELNLEKDNYSVMYIEIIYKRFRTSNMIFFKKEQISKDTKIYN